MKPGRTLFHLLGALLLLAAVATLARLPGAAAGEGAALLWLVAVVAVVLLALFDGLRVIRETPPLVQRTLPRSLALGRANRIGLYLHNPLARRVSGVVADHHPDSLVVHDLPRPFSLPGRGELRLDYRVEPGRRGELSFAATELSVDSPWGLWRRRVLRRERATLRVYPDFLAGGSLREISAEHSAALLGIHLQRRRGEGTDFRQLREFRQGDILRQVDWKASARMCKLVSREYQDEHDRDIVFLLDCGRRMHANDGALSHFDHALNAMLLTAWFALKQGDGVGVCTFAGPDRWLEPRKYRNGIRGLMDQLYDLQAGTDSSDFLEAARRLAGRRNKRALVILLTNIQAEDDVDLQRAVGILRTRHALILANLREAELVQRAHADIDTFQGALAHCVASDLLRSRERVVRALRAQGASVVDCLPRQLNRALASQYLALKRSGAF